MADRPLETKKRFYERLRAQLENERASFISTWRECGEYIVTRRPRFTTSDRNRGERRSSKIIDSTATQSARTLSSGMMAGITSPARPWKRLTTPDPDLRENALVKDWLHAVDERMNTVFSQSNLYNALPILYTDMGVFATGAMLVDEHPTQVIRCTSFPIGSYLIANDADGRVRVFMREFGMTVRQLVERFGKNGDDMTPFSQKVKDAWKDNKSTEQWVDVVHVIMPNKEANVNRLESKYKPFISCYYEKGSNEDLYLEEKGYDEWPVLVGRWSVTGEDSWGTDCPGMMVLGDVKALQLGERRGAQAMEKIINPPMVGPPGLASTKASLLPGDITYVQEGQYATFRPVHEIKPDLSQWEYRQEQIRTRIRRGLYEDLFLMLAYSDPSRGKQPVTATEIAERQEEKLLALGPVLEQLNQDVLDPLIDRVFGIMLRAGLVPEPPQELEGMPLKVEYISIMAQAQKMVGLSALERFWGFVGSIATQQAAAPGAPIWDKADADQSVDEYADMTGVAPRVVVSDDQVKAVRQQRAQQQEEQRQTALAEQEASAAQKLGNAKTGPDNVLGKLLGSPGLAA